MMLVSAHAVVRSFFTPARVEGLRPEIVPKKNRPDGRSIAFRPPPPEKHVPVWALFLAGKP